MRRWLGAIAFLLSLSSYGQETPKDIGRLRVSLAQTHSDTLRVILLSEISGSYNTVDIDSSYYFATEALALSKQLNYKRGIARACFELGAVDLRRGDIASAISYLEQSIHLADSLKDYEIAYNDLSQMGLCMVYLEDYYRAIEYFKRALDYEKDAAHDDYTIMILMHIADAYLDNNNFTEAEEYLNKALAFGEQRNPDFGWLLNMLGSLHLEQKKYAAADSILSLAWKKIENQRDIFNKADNRYYYARLTLNTRQTERAHDYAREALNYYQQTDFSFDLARIYKLMSTIESERGRIQEALNYLLRSNSINDATQNMRARNSALLFEKHEQEKQTQLSKKEKELQESEKRNLRLFWIGSISVFFVVTIGLLFAIRQKQRSNQELLKFNATVLEMNAAKDKLFSIIGHDLKGPLNALTGFSSLLSDHSDMLSKEELKKLSVDLDKSLKNLLVLLENLLEWSQSQTGAIDFKPEVFDVATLIRENQELFSGQAQNKNITIVNEVNSFLAVFAHRNSINTVVRNLLSNAIKFTPEGGTVILKAERSGQSARISIADNGTGINESDIHYLFKVGSKHSTLGTAKEKGTGLGLALCKEFVEKNGGTIGVSSTPGKGTNFYFTVPVPAEDL